MSWGVGSDVLEMKNVCRTTVTLMAYASWVPTEDIQAQITWGAGQGPLIMANNNNKVKVINHIYSENNNLQWGIKNQNQKRVCLWYRYDMRPR